MCDTRTLFARKGMRFTRQRQEVYEALAATRSHPTAEGLLWMVRQRSPGMGLSLATVYNALESFCEHDLARRLPSAVGGCARFDADLHEHLHIATPDGAVVDVPDDLGAKVMNALPKDLLGEVERRMSVRLVRVRVDFSAEPAPQPRA